MPGIFTETVQHSPYFPQNSGGAEKVEVDNKTAIYSSAKIMDVLYREFRIEA